MWPLGGEVTYPSLARLSPALAFCTSPDKFFSKIKKQIEKLVTLPAQVTVVRSVQLDTTRNNFWQSLATNMLQALLYNPHAWQANIWTK